MSKFHCPIENLDSTYFEFYPSIKKFKPSLLNLNEFYISIEKFGSHLLTVANATIWDLRYFYMCGRDKRKKETFLRWSENIVLVREELFWERKFHEILEIKHILPHK